MDKCEKNGFPEANTMKMQDEEIDDERNRFLIYTYFQLCYPLFYYLHGKKLQTTID
jgi:hypothetical protein